MRPDATPRVLYQLPISHDCEETRWHEDAKGLCRIRKGTAEEGRRGGAG